jgi:hypothetical protein
MLLALIVIVNGAFVPSSPPVRLLFGHVVAPLAPVIARISDRVSLAGDTVTVARGGRTCVFEVGSPAFQCDGVIRRAAVTPFARDGIVYVPLAAAVRAFGGTIAIDARSATVDVTMPATAPFATPSPFDASAPQATPTRLFTPQPPPPTPRPVESVDPRPRRTAVPATPSRVPEG